jgi:excisionase family DNA binding protein
VAKAPSFQGKQLDPTVFLIVLMSIVERHPAEAEPLTRADVLTASEASALLGIPRSTLYDLARRQELPARQIGRRWIFRNPCSTAQLPQSEADTWSRPSA